ncbi:hypothetical protein QQF40_12780 [Cobetia sp. LC6]|uniref:hypothetical protein n=1 Tax=Cobetia TaxID=204286 RepID=UPI002552CBE6|nr:hypothetical protein [Cobetia sp. LC6]MDL2192265.1 hypothetical protein [Cobetia sp. LC6]
MSEQGDRKPIATVSPVRSAQLVAIVLALIELFRGDWQGALLLGGLGWVIGLFKHPR